MYNLTNITDNANTWYEIIYEVNTISDGLYFTMVIVLAIFAYWIIFKKSAFKDVFLAGSFFGAFLSTLLFWMELVNSDFIIIPYITFFAGILVYIFNNE